MRTKRETANIKELQKLIVKNTVLDHRPLIAYVMAHCGATVREIGEVFGISRQQAHTIVTKAQERAEGEKQ